MTTWATAHHLGSVLGGRDSSRLLGMKNKARSSTGRPHEARSGQRRGKASAMMAARAGDAPCLARDDPGLLERRMMLHLRPSSVDEMPVTDQGTDA